LKSAEAFRTISEVSELLDTPTHVLRFWESRFTQVKPVKRAGGRRYYRPGDVALLGGIKRLLHDDGLTIRGVQKLLRERGISHVAGLAPDRVIGALGAGAADVSDTAETPTDDAGKPSDLTAAVSGSGGRWPETGSPDAADGAATLLPDPDEAPMHVDAPTLPARGSGMVTALGRTRGEPPAQPPAYGPSDATPDLFAAGDRANGLTTEPGADAAPLSGPDEIDLPAARLLRAMTALRAREHRPALLSIYDRAMRLHHRLSQGIETAETHT
jgi:DNA-binding transcriptional MerR regulator